MASKRPRKLKSSSRTGSKAARSSRTRVVVKRTAPVKKKPAAAKKTATPKRVKRATRPPATMSPIAQGSIHAPERPAPTAAPSVATYTPPPRSELLVQAKAAAIPGRHQMTLAQLRTALAQLADQPAAVAASSSWRTSVTPTVPPALTGLPWRYGVTELVAMPVDPVLVHVYWELTPDAVSRVQAQLGSRWEGAGQLLRAYDVATAQGHDGNDAELVAHARHHFDFDINGDVGSYYIHLWRPDQRLIFEVGWRTREGRFAAATRSNLVVTPRNAADGGGPEQWATARNGGPQ